MKDAYSVRDISRILGCCDQCVLNDVKIGLIHGRKVASAIKGRFAGWVFSFSETANYINLKRRSRRRKA